VSQPRKSASTKERLRRRYRPDRVRILFIGESPPASGRFFYQGDSGLYRAVRDAFMAAFPKWKPSNFLEAFRALNCYLIDLCGKPVDKLNAKSRQQICRAGEPRLAKTIRHMNPEIIVVVVRSIAPNISRATKSAKWSGLRVEVPYPGRWINHRRKFQRVLKQLLRRTFSNSNQSGSSANQRDRLAQ
jgi:hypothetical protein